MITTSAPTIPITNLERAISDYIDSVRTIRDISDEVIKHGEYEEDAWNTLEEIHAIADNLLWPN